MSTKFDSINQGVASAPPAAVAGLTLAGVSLQDTVLLATLIWITVQFGWFCYTRYKEWRDAE